MQSACRCKRKYEVMWNVEPKVTDRVDAAGLPVHPNKQGKEFGTKGRYLLFNLQSSLLNSEALTPNFQLLIPNF